MEIVWVHSSMAQLFPVLKKRLWGKKKKKKKKEKEKRMEKLNYEWRFSVIKKK